MIAYLEVDDDDDDTTNDSETYMNLAKAPVLCQGFIK
jgi:hypothetical protein